MSIEALIQAHIDALKENTAALNANSDNVAKHNALIGGLAGRIPGGTTGTTPAANTATATADAPKETATEKKKREKAEAEARKKAEEEAAKNKPAITLESVRSDITVWLKASENGSEEFEAKRTELKRLLTHFGVEKVTDLPADKLTEFAGYFESVKNGEDPLPADESDADAEADPLL